MGRDAGSRVSDTSLGHGLRQRLIDNWNGLLQNIVNDAVDE